MLSDTLTDVAVRNLAARPERFEVFDAKVPGFAVRVFPSGVKSFVVFYRSKGRLRRLTLGRYPTISLSEARRLANDALNRAAHGHDPQGEKQADRGGMRFAEVVETFVELHCIRHNRAKSASMRSRLISNMLRRSGQAVSAGSRMTSRSSSVGSKRASRESVRSMSP